MRDDQTQLFKMEYSTRCDTFGCGEYGAYFVGRPDGPLNTSLVLCQVCADSLIESVQAFATSPAESDYNVLERLSEARTHAVLDEIIEELGLESIPDREIAKFQERKELILAAYRASEA